jgi:hypothetical protein
VDVLVDVLVEVLVLLVDELVVVVVGRQFVTNEQNVAFTARFV